MINRDQFVLEFPTAGPRVVWGLAADTNRASRAIGLAAGEFTAEVDPMGQMAQVGRGTQLGFALEWVTGPDSWVEGSWYRTIRRYRLGPVTEAVIDYRIEPGAGGSRVTVTRSTTGDVAAVLFDRFLVGSRLRRYLGESVAVAERCANDPTCGQPATQEIAKALPYVTSGVINGAAKPTNAQELEVRRRTLRDAPLGEGGQELIDKLVTFLREQPDEAVADLSPVHFAAWAQSPLREVLRVFLLATRAGILELRWSMRCQSCRTSAGIVSSLEDLPGEVRCPGCGTVFGPDFSAHVEASFSIHRGLRRVYVHKFCTAGAASRPQVFAQLVASADQPCEVEAPLLDGELTLRVLGLPRVHVLPHRPASIVVTVTRDAASVEVVPAASSAPSSSASTRIAVRCEGGSESAVVLLERSSWKQEWVSAAQLATVPEFHELFGGEAPRTRHEITVGTLTMLFSDLRGSTALYQQVGDSRAFTLVADHFDRLTQAVEANEGALIKTMGDAVMAVFQTPPAAIRAALAMQRAISESVAGSSGLVLKLGVHTGNCLAVRANGRLDFFGHNVNLAARAQAQSHGDDIVITEAVLAHPEVPGLLEGVTRDAFDATLKGIDRPQRLWRIKPEARKLRSA